MSLPTILWIQLFSTRSAWPVFQQAVSRQQHDDFDRFRSRIDQQLRTSLEQLDRDLREVCYVGPKRRTVPRNLNSDVMDEFDNWGDGLGAWRWLLQCSTEDFKSCSNLLSCEATGLGTGFSLEREEIAECPTSILQLLKEFEEQNGRVGRSDVEMILNDPDFRDWSSPRQFQRICLREGDERRRRHPQDVGEGITQVVPVIAAFVRSSTLLGTPRLIAIEQPELHLHPSLAARIGDLAISSVTTAPCQSIALVETHSEHLILRILRRIRQTTNCELPDHIPPVKPDDVCVLWVDNLGDGTTFQRLRIDDQGEFIDRWPKGFFSERAEELF